MIKRLFIALAAILCLSSAAVARDSYAHSATVLPKAAQTVLSKNFKSEVSVVKIDKELGRVSEYEVVLTDGSEITFDRNGNWKNVEVSASRSVPEGFIPADVQKYVKANAKGAKIVGIEIERSGYEVELSNGVDMKFDKNGRFVRYDD